MSHVTRKCLFCTFIRTHNRRRRRGRAAVARAFVGTLERTDFRSEGEVERGGTAGGNGRGQPIVAARLPAHIATPARSQDGRIDRTRSPERHHFISTRAICINFFQL